MTQTVSDFVIQRLHQWDVRHIFGYCFWKRSRLETNEVNHGRFP